MMNPDLLDYKFSEDSAKSQDLEFVFLEESGPREEKCASVDFTATYKQFTLSANLLFSPIKTS